MPKYWAKNYFAHGSFPEVGQKQKTEKKKRERKKRPKVGDNNCQATHGALKLPGPISTLVVRKKESKEGSERWVNCPFYVTIRYGQNPSLLLYRLSLGLSFDRFSKSAILV